MHPSSISNSDHSPQVGSLFATGGLAIGVFIVVTLIVRMFPDSILVEGDSAVIRNMMLTESTYLQADQKQPKLLILGSSRLMQLDSAIVAAEAGIELGDVLNLSSPGMTFFYMDALLRKYPELMQEVEFVAIDILSYQIMYSTSYDESSPFFRRNAALSHRLVIPEFPNRAIALADFAVPAWSRSQTPAQWHLGVQRQFMTLEQLETSIRHRPLGDFPQWKAMSQELATIAGDETALRLFIADRLIGRKDVAQSQIVALHDVIDKLPADSMIGLIWLPIDEATSAVIQNSGYLPESMEVFREVIEGLSDSKVHMADYSTSESLGLVQKDLSNDGIHPSPSGSVKIANLIGRLYRDQ